MKGCWAVKAADLGLFHRASALLLCLIALWWGCSDDQAPSLGALDQVDQGWQAYGASDYASALIRFERAVSQAPTLADAHNGLGWSRLGNSQELFLNPHLIDQALNAFQDALRHDPENPDAWVGFANTLFLRRKSPKDFIQAVEALGMVESKRNSPYLYRHDYVSFSDLLALKASCYYYLGDMEAASLAVQEALQQNPEQETALVLQRMLRDQAS